MIKQKHVAKNFQKIWSDIRTTGMVFVHLSEQISFPHVRSETRVLFEFCTDMGMVVLPMATSSRIGISPPGTCWPFLSARSCNSQIWEIPEYWLMEALLTIQKRTISIHIHIYIYNGVYYNLLPPLPFVGACDHHWNTASPGGMLSLSPGAWWVTVADAPSFFHRFSKQISTTTGPCALVMAAGAFRFRKRSTLLKRKSGRSTCAAQKWMEG